MGSLLQLGELDLDERLQVEGSHTTLRALGVHLLDRHLLGLLRRLLLDHLFSNLLQRSFLRRLGLHRWGLQGLQGYLLSGSLVGLESGGLLDQRGFLHSNGWVGLGLNSWGLHGLESWRPLGPQGHPGSCSLQLLDWSLLRLRLGGGLLLVVRIGALV